MTKPTGQLLEITTKCSLSDGHGVLKAGNMPGQLSVIRGIKSNGKVWPRTMPRGNEVISTQQRHRSETDPLRLVSHFGCYDPRRFGGRGLQQPPSRFVARMVRHPLLRGHARQ